MVHNLIDKLDLCDNDAESESNEDRTNSSQIFLNMSDSLDESSSIDELITHPKNLSTNQREEADDDFENDDLDEDKLAYLPCAAHNLQLVIKDALKKINTFDKVISIVSRFIKKCRKSTTIADEFRNMKKSLLQKNVTRWNSVFFMVRSFNKLSVEEYKRLLSLVPGNQQSI